MCLQLDLWLSTWHAAFSRYMARLKIRMPKDYIICWIYPHPVTVANKGLDRFRWIPYQKCDNPGVHCYWLGGRSKSYPGSSILDVQFELWLHKTIVARKMSTPGADGQEPTLKQHGAKDSGNGCGSWITRSMVLFRSLSYIFGMGDDIRFVKKRKKEDKEDTSLHQFECSTERAAKH